MARISEYLSKSLISLVLVFLKKLSLEKFFSLPTLKLTSNHTLFILNVISKFYKLEIVYINIIKVLTLAKSELL